MRTFLLKILPVICIVNCGPYFWLASCKMLSAALYFLNFVLF